MDQKSNIAKGDFQIVQIRIPHQILREFTLT